MLSWVISTPGSFDIIFFNAIARPNARLQDRWCRFLVACRYRAIAAIDPHYKGIAGPLILFCSLCEIAGYMQSGFA